ncbi:MAG: Tm-1-like ATP-binding domain-containing protein [Pauljensenia sp.]
MRPSAAILGSWDTKCTEMRYMRDRLQRMGLSVLLVDVSTRQNDIPTDEVQLTSDSIQRTAQERGIVPTSSGRADMIEFMAKAAACIVKELFDRNSIQGILSAGGLQNTTLAVGAMEALPIGFPKVLATTVASGNRTFSSVLGNRDIVVVPSLADLAGLNFATKATLDCACDCLAGMIQNTHVARRTKDRLVVGLTMMGVTNQGAAGALAHLQSKGIETVGFHTTGAGGAVLESFIREGKIDAVLDMNLHEIVSEYFGGGYSFGATGRLTAAVDCQVPMVLAPGGLDFVDYYVKDFSPGLKGRKFVLHNGSLAHIKLNVAEAEAVGEVVGKRLRHASAPVLMLVPTSGLRSDSGVGEAMFDPEVDHVLVESILSSASETLEVEYVDSCLDSREFGAAAAERLFERTQGLRERIDGSGVEE